MTLSRSHVLSGLLLLVPLLAGAATLPPGFTEKVLASGIVRPTAMAIAPDGRIFVCEQTGALRIVRDGRLLPSPFLTLPVYSQVERGLLGVALDPEFPLRPYVYVYYTAPKPAIHNRLSRFTAVGDRASRASEVVLLDFPALGKPIHNAGAIHFAPDGKLFVSVGENAVPENAQRLTNPLGKILRLNRDGSIPTDNPFYNQTTGLARAIWALGLRNPFSFSIDRSGRLFINDVGKSTWEEINEGAAGANYGWPLTEGSTDNPAFRSPIYAYRHGPSPETGCAITGSAFYEPAIERFPAEYRGSYFFGDFCSGWIRRLDPSQGNAVFPFATGIGAPVALTVGEDGGFYYLAYEDGALVRVDFTGSPAPRISEQPQDQTVAVGASATFRVGASGTPAPTFQWRRNGVPIPGATNATYTLEAASLADDKAVFAAVATNASGSATSRAAKLTVLDDHAPVASIAEPAPGTLYIAGGTLGFSGSGSDAEDGALPPSALTWRIDFHHDTHFHPFAPSTSGVTGGSVVIPNTGETAANVWYRVHLAVKDSAGLTGSTFVDVLPRTSELTFATDPPGLELTLDASPLTAPLTETGVAGMVRDLGATTPQRVDGTVYLFDSWSDRGPARHNVVTPLEDLVLTAEFQALPPETQGLVGTYYDDRNLTRTNLSRVDPTVSFNWLDGSPALGIGPDTWSVRWTGQVEAKVTGLHHFFVRSDDGVRLWIDGVPIIDDWRDHLAALSHGTVELVAGRRYGIRLEYYDNEGPASIRLLWSAPGLVREVVPASQLRP